MSAASARRHRGHGGEEHGEEGGMERWLLTYADMITLLLALFVVLFAMSTISLKKFLEFKLGLTQAFNPSAISKPGSNGLLDKTSLAQEASSASATRIAPISSSLSKAKGPTSSSSAANQATAQLQHIAAKVSSALAKQHLSADASVTVSAKGVVVQVLADKAFFATDSASLGEAGNEVVDTIAGVVRKDPNNIVAEGFTDNQPIIGGPYSSNWELSAARAANVANRLNVVDHIPETRLSAQGYGQTHTVASNATPAGRAQNRRIDVVILSTSP